MFFQAKSVLGAIKNISTPAGFVSLTALRVFFGLTLDGIVVAVFIAFWIIANA